MTKRTKRMLWFVAAITCAGAAHAQTGGSEAAATALFEEGRRLMNQGKYADACPKLAESQRLAPSGGTLLNLAECYEKNGQTASAWAALKAVAARANAAGKHDVEKRALERASALEPNLARLTISLASGSDVPGLAIKRDGVEVGRAEIGVALPVDPGPHTIEASAPKKKAFAATVKVEPKDARAQVTIKLEDEPEAVTPPMPSASATTSSTLAPPPPPPPGDTGGTQRTIGLVVGGVGIVGLALGSVFGLQAKSKNDDALAHCRTSTLCDQAGLDLTDRAKSAATLSTIGFGVGAVGVVAGAVLFLTAPSAPKQATEGWRIVPIVGANGAGVTVRGAW